MSEIRVNSLGNETNTGGPELSGITEFSGQQYFIPPKGTTAERPSGCPAGSIRFNTDSAHLEYWNGLVWLEFEASSEELGNTTLSNAELRSPSGTGTRGVYMRGQTPSNATEIEYITVETLGTPVEFGALQVTNGGGNAPFSSRTRAIFHGGSPGDADIEFITISSTGNGTDWGADLNRSSFYGMGAANQTRGLSAGNYPGSQTATDFVTIASAGTVNDFGNLFFGGSHGASVQSPTRCVFMGGYAPGTNTNKMQTYQFATTGNAIEFGELAANAWNSGGVCSSTRGVCAIGSNPGNTNAIEFITLSTYGNSQDFGDATVSLTHRGGGVCSPTRGLFMGGWDGSDDFNTMEYVTIPTTGNAIDFGDLSAPAFNVYGCSNGHGGL